MRSCRRVDMGRARPRYQAHLLFGSGVGMVRTRWRTSPRAFETAYRYPHVTGSNLTLRRALMTRVTDVYPIEMFGRAADESSDHGH